MTIWHNKRVESPWPDHPVTFKSQAEFRYARGLHLLQTCSPKTFKWDYEPVTFWFPGIKRGVTNYKPDFRVDDGGQVFFVEVKTALTRKDITKYHRMAKYFASVPLALAMSRIPKKGKQVELLAEARKYVRRVIEIPK